MSAVMSAANMGLLAKRARKKRIVKISMDSMIIIARARFMVDIGGLRKGGGREGKEEKRVGQGRGDWKRFWRPAAGSPKD